jgi:hypothetical protein
MPRKMRAYHSLAQIHRQRLAHTPRPPVTGGKDESGFNPLGKSSTIHVVQELL